MTMQAPSEVHGEVVCTCSSGVPRGTGSTVPVAVQIGLHHDRLQTVTKLVATSQAYMLVHGFPISNVESTRSTSQVRNCHYSWQ